MQAVKEMVIAEWPKDFPRPAPADTAEVRLILNGKVLENGKTLMECRTPTVGGELPGLGCRVKGVGCRV